SLLYGVHDFPSSAANRRANIPYLTETLDTETLNYGSDPETNCKNDKWRSCLWLFLCRSILDGSSRMGRIICSRSGEGESPLSGRRQVRPQHRAMQKSLGKDNDRSRRTLHPRFVCRNNRIVDCHAHWNPTPI